MSQAAPAKLRGVHVLTMLLLFFGAVIAINVGFGIMAVRTFPGEDERRSYTQGLHYNQTLAERRDQAALGWRAEGELAAVGNGAEVRVRLVDAQAHPLDDVTVEGVLRWPPNISGDQPLEFRREGDGVYVARLASLPPGRWDLRARAHDARGGSLDFEAELTWPSGR